MRPSRARRPRVLAVAALLAAGAVTAIAVPAAGAAVRRGPSGAAFYKAPARLLKGRHGSLIWARPADPTTTLAAGAATWKVLYRSVSPRGRAIAVSGLITLPRTRAPKGGWGVVSWAHGTTGVADVCAPSRDTPTGPAHDYIPLIDPSLDAWLAAGDVVARTDYEGLGTPGTHPYLIGTSEGRGVVDIVRAARELDRRVGTRWVAAGHSEGGQGSLFAGAIGARWAPELKLRGVVSYAPASHLLDQAKLLPGLTAPGGRLSAFAALVVAGAATQSAGIDLHAVASDPVLGLLGQVNTGCLAQLAADTSFGGLAPAALLRPGADTTALFSVLAAMNPALRIPVPVLMLQGSADQTVFQAFTDKLATELKGLGDTVDYRTYAGESHRGVLTAGAADASAFVAARLG